MVGEHTAMGNHTTKPIPVLPLVPVTDPILKNPLGPCSDDLNRKELQNNLWLAMLHYQGVGLSANQVGIVNVFL